jgi:hypothetical protein
MAEIVGGLFGLDPQQLMRQRQTTDASNAFRFAQLSPMERAQYSIYQGSAGLGRGIQGLLGGDAEMQKASKIQELSSQFDLSTPQGAREFGRALQPFAPVEAMKALTKADAMEQAGLGRQKTQADIERTQGLISREDAAAAQNEQLRSELSAAIQRGASREEIRMIAAKYGSADKILQILSEDQRRADALAAKAAGGGTGVGGGVNNNGVPIGTFDKVGRYTSPTGRVFTAKAVEEAQSGHDNAQDLLDRLQNVTEEDINRAFGSAADYTTMTGGKLIGPTKTLDAQTKINEVGIRSVLTNLQKLKGPSSDKEMAQMIKDFPGYQAKPEIMKNWVERATRVTNKFLERNENRFGFDTEYAEEGRFNKPKDKTTPNQNEQAMEWLRQNPTDPRAPAVRKKLGL